MPKSKEGKGKLVEERTPLEAPSAEPVLGGEEASLSKSSNGWGGAREGAGRKKTGDRFSKVKETLNDELERIARDFVPRSLEELVNGFFREEVGPRGTTRIYSVPPNVGAIQEVLNRILGKPVTSLEVSGPGGEPLELEMRDARDRLLEMLSKLESPSPEARLEGPSLGLGAPSEPVSPERGGETP